MAGRGVGGARCDHAGAPILVGPVVEGGYRAQCLVCNRRGPTEESARRALEALRPPSATRTDTAVCEGRGGTPEEGP